jgi:hypothetical protein
VRSGVKVGDLPESAWADAETKPFVPSTYSVCYEQDTANGTYRALQPAAVLRLFPARAQAILRDEATDGCTKVTTDETRALFGILGTMSSFEMPTSDMVRVEDSQGREIYWNIRMMLPHGRWYPCPGCW